MPWRSGVQKLCFSSNHCHRSRAQCEASKARNRLQIGQSSGTRHQRVGNRRSAWSVRKSEGPQPHGAWPFAFGWPECVARMSQIQRP